MGKNNEDLPEELQKVMEYIGSDKDNGNTGIDYKHNFDYKPWNDKENEYRDKAIKRLSELTSLTREKVTSFDFSLDANKVIQQIPVDYKTSNVSKYNRVTVQKVYDIVSATGRERPVYDEYDLVTRPTLMRWKHRYPEFLWLMLKARENFRLYQWEVNPELKRLAIQALYDALSGKRTETWRTAMQGEDGKKVAKVNKRTAPPPKWAIELILGLYDDKSRSGGKNQVTELTLE